MIHLTINLSYLIISYLLFQSNEWIRVRIQQMEPDLMEVGSTLEEAKALRREHDELLMKLNVSSYCISLLSYLWFDVMKWNPFMDRSPFQYIDCLSKYRDSHYKDKSVVKLSLLSFNQSINQSINQSNPVLLKERVRIYNGNLHTGKISTIYFLLLIFSIFISELIKCCLFVIYQVHIWQVSPQLSCGDTCQIWTWFKWFNP